MKSICRPSGQKSTFKAYAARTPGDKHKNRLAIIFSYFSGDKIVSRRKYS